MLPIKYQKFKSSRRFGIELEIDESIPKSKIKYLLDQISHKNTSVTKYQASIGNDFWHIKDDATCGSKGRFGPRGIEVASFVAKGLKDLNHISEVADVLSICGCKVNKNCGMHIHAEAIDLNIDHVGILMAYWLKIQEIMTFSLPNHRRNNVYCAPIFEFSSKNIALFSKPIQTHAWLPVDIWEILRPYNLGYYENYDRRVNLNFVNYARACHYETNTRKTIELRWPEGTLNSRDIRCWVKLFLTLIDNCKNLSMPKNLFSCDLNETLNLLGVGHNDSFSILDAELHEMKTWFLERIIKFAGKSKSALFLKQEAKLILNQMWEPIKKYA